MVSFIGMFTLVHPFATTWHFPSRGNEGYEGKNSESYTSGTISAFSPFGGWRHHLSPACGESPAQPDKGEPRSG